MVEEREKKKPQVRIRLRRLSRIQGGNVVPRRFPLVSRRHGMSSDVACRRRTFEPCPNTFRWPSTDRPSVIHTLLPLLPETSSPLASQPEWPGQAWRGTELHSYLCLVSAHLIVSWLSSSVFSSISVRIIFPFIFLFLHFVRSQVYTYVPFTSSYLNCRPARHSARRIHIHITTFVQDLDLR